MVRKEKLCVNSNKKTLITFTRKRNLEHLIPSTSFKKLYLGIEVKYYQRQDNNDLEKRDWKNIGTKAIIGGYTLRKINENI